MQNDVGIAAQQKLRNKVEMIAEKFFYITLFTSFFFSSRRMPGLRFAITQQQKSILTSSIYGPLTHAISYTGKSNPPCLKPLGEPIDPGIQKAWIILHSFIHSFILSGIFN